jgi:Lon protease-like protein
MSDTDISFQDLPPELAIFPLPRVILLPRISLPLNIFEPRYLRMVDHAMRNGRIIGMIQARENNDIHDTGCAGRIVSFSETDDNRYLITLRGVCRFTVSRELPRDAGGFRMVAPDWTPWRDDCLGEAAEENVCREAMMPVLEAYLSKMNILCDQWEAMRTISCDRLVSTLSVICPFAADEKQALLEARTLQDRMRLLQGLFEMALREDDREACVKCH